ncbi:hypothetical protein AT15_06115 [Kosmotoga arenicorallina S304]|uniref:Glycogen debranching protein n=1 Tax=Kosmotoga arenicorallina S304 TaxID=1453497 RepID=A0A176K3Q1_9BACT|nr:amylo-alpha-1,6-glucosidase [Kosmotoga arenicorallina]OAA31646.1 hypothetical protein AT15_06115 [Kosmotoga arenicorallina S304]
MKIMKNGNLMMVSDDNGTIDSMNYPAAGLYLEDTRFCSGLQLRTDKKARKLKTRFTFDGLINRYLLRSSPLKNDYDLFVEETLKLLGNKLEVEIKLDNFSDQRVELKIDYSIRCGYEDIFAVRELNDSYFGLSNSEILSEHKGFFHEDETATYRIENTLPGGHFILKPKEVFSTKGYLHFKKELKSEKLFKNILEDRPIRLDLNGFGEFPSIIKGTLDDLKMLMIPTKYGDFPAAGLPWYATVFGRDSLIFALQTLNYFPDIAKTVLEVLGAFQADVKDDFRDATPGKIIHEARLNYLSLNNQLPFERYYGTIDATLLYIILAGEYLKFTDDIETVKGLFPHIEAAERWIYEYGDSDGDGYVEYLPLSERGLKTQGWKDSGDSVSFKSGELAQPPVAFVEVQGYLYLAYHLLACIYRRLGKENKAYSLDEKAKALKYRFNRDFWLEDEKYFAIALDGNKRKVDSISSNPGQCLFTGIVDDDKVAPVVKKLLSPELFTGWGIRTLSTDMRRYNPFSYHNGSVWPHDNSIIIMGLLKYGYTKEAKKISEALLEAMDKFHDKRLPELFSGLSREETKNDVVEYPASCSPQLWSIGTIFTIAKALEVRKVDDKGSSLS